jgi:transcription initiation factor TFIIB
MISEKTVRRAAEMMSVMKQDPISFGKDPGALASAVLYAACLEQGEKIAQGHVASAANVSIVTLRKRFIDVRKVFPNVPNGPTDLALVKARN